MAWKSTAQDSYNMYMEKEAVSRQIRALAFISNWLILLAYTMLPPTLIAADQGPPSTFSTFKFNVTDVLSFSISCLVIGCVSTTFLICRYFNNLIFRLDVVLMPTLTTSFVGIVSCLFNFTGRKGEKVLTGNAAVLLSFTIIAFVVVGITTFYAYRQFARVKYTEKYSRVVSMHQSRSSYSCCSLPSTATTNEYLKRTREKRSPHQKKQSTSSKKNLLTVITSSVNPASQSTSTIATFMDNGDGSNNTANNYNKTDNIAASNTIQVNNTTQKGSNRPSDVPTSPTIRTANFAISVRAPNPAAWKPNVTIHSSNSHSRSGSRSHSRSNSSSIYSASQPDLRNNMPAQLAYPVHSPIMECNASSTLGAARGSNASYATFLPPSSAPTSPLPAIPTAAPLSPDDFPLPAAYTVSSPKTKSKHVPSDVRYLLQEANEVLIGFSHVPEPKSPETVKAQNTQNHLSLGPSNFQSRCGSPHPRAFLPQLQLPPTETPSLQSQSMFLGELYDCYKYDEEEHSSEFRGLQLSQLDLTDLDGGVRDSIVSSGSASQSRRSRKGSLGNGEVNMRDQDRNYNGVYI